MLRLFFITIACVLLSACQSTPSEIKLRDQNTELKNQLATAQQDIANLRSEHQIMAGDNTELKRLISILEKEQKFRTEQATQLRGDTRQFAQSLVEQLKDFLGRADLLDYVGASLTDRRKMDIASAVVIDASHPMPKNGVLSAVDGVFGQATRFSVNVLRPIDEGDYVVVWQSPYLQVTKSGQQRIKLPSSTSVEAGDVLAYYFPDSMTVKYDQGTGGSLIAEKPFALGDAVEFSDLDKAEEKRAYSIGGVGILR